MSLRISLVQTDIAWQNPELNRLHIEELLWEMEETTDLLILPELFSTGFTFSNNLAEPHNLHTFKWMKQMASLKQAFVIGSLLIKEKGKYYNRCYCINPNGGYETYDKQHLFSLSEEKEFCTSGNSSNCFDVKGWKIMPSICYDLRFPVTLRNTNNYDILINIANWPTVRKETWQTLLKARAIENQCYSIGVNRVGNDENQLTYNGESNIYSFEGIALAKNSTQENIQTITIEKSLLAKFRIDYPFLNDLDAFKLVNK